MSQARTVIFDNEAVQALSEPGHRKHRRALAVVEAVAARNLRRAGSVRLVVPTAVRVEAGWDRQALRAAAINRVRIADVSLDTATANAAARVCSTLEVSVADSHLGAVLGATEGPHAVLTGDVDDLRRIAQHVGVDAQIVQV